MMSLTSIEPEAAIEIVPLPAVTTLIVASSLPKGRASTFFAEAPFSLKFTVPETSAKGGTGWGISTRLPAMVTAPATRVSCACRSGMASVSLRSALPSALVERSAWPMKPPTGLASR